MTFRPYAVDWRPDAKRDLRRLDGAIVARIVRAVKKFADSGEGDVKRLQGVDYRFRLRVGDWRVIFTVDDAIRVLFVLRALPRGSAYR